jgi:outer membrane protein TolC
MSLCELLDTQATLILLFCGHARALFISGCFLYLLGGFQVVAQQRSGEISLLESAQSVLEHHPLIRFQEAQIDIARGLKQQASGAFDSVLNAGISQGRTTTPLTAAQQEANTLIGAPGADELTDLTQIGFGVSRLFRSGISLSPTVAVTRDVDNILNPQGVNTANPNVQITIPLLRGRGRRVVAAQEMAAETEVVATAFDLTNEASTLLKNMANDYWNLVASQKLLAIAVEAEDRAQTDLNNTQTLVDADQLPRENLNEVNANVAQSASSRIAAEQNLIAAQYQLAMDIGMDSQAIATTLLIPSDDFPPLDSREYPSLTLDALQADVQVALENRSDFLASKQRVDEQKMLVVAAKNHLRPQVNLTANGGYNGLQEGRRFKDVFDSLGNNVEGPNASAGISYNFAPRNEQARGAYLQAVATQTQLESQSLQLAHTISAAVTSAAQAVHNAALETDKAREAVDFYRKSLTGQREKYHLGTASVVDVLTVEDRLTTAMTTEVQAVLSYALALTQFRFATGTIVPPGKTVLTIGADVFRTLPSFNHPAQQP